MPLSYCAASCLQTVKLDINGPSVLHMPCDFSRYLPHLACKTISFRSGKSVEAPSSCVGMVWKFEKWSTSSVVILFTWLGFRSTRSIANNARVDFIKYLLNMWVAQVPVTQVEEQLFNTRESIIYPICLGKQ
ncbi:hypothetical protein TNCV_587511 [Trichonephila clavipes]|nr:hypothetical protein TNCV_587511 [Trichonephila clavipes]